MAAIAAVPVLLILTVLALMPHAAPPGGGGLGGGGGAAAAEFSRAQPFSRTGFEKNSGGNVAERWSVVIDAGSTGSRIHIFKAGPERGAASRPAGACACQQSTHPPTP